MTLEILIEGCNTEKFTVAKTEENEINCLDLIIPIQDRQVG
jgi:hypothetical protein